MSLKCLVSPFWTCAVGILYIYNVFSNFVENAHEQIAD